MPCPLHANVVDPSDRNAILESLNSYLDPDQDGNVVVFRWSTFAENATIGFYVERQLDDGHWTQVNENMLPGLLSPMGGEYLLLDPGAQIAQYLPVSENHFQYRLIELEATGRTRTYGPFDLVLQ